MSEDRFLDRAIAEWRSAPPVEKLSEAARSRILRETIEAQETQPVPSRLRSAAWKVLAGALPVAAAVLVAFVYADRVGDRSGAPMRVRATKNGSEVVFLIANGKNDHSVYKSSAPNSFDTSTPLPVRGGSFRDRTDDGSGLVFYRIE